LKETTLDITRILIEQDKEAEKYDEKTAYLAI
jgi:hypothetical protein